MGHKCLSPSGSIKDNLKMKKRRLFLAFLFIFMFRQQSHYIYKEFYI